ncbi:hypothetical protein RAS2_16590 [Phycisphaerae bacterium RAS2]|nr:hypothetical protein RAS2_16590 [Phycisphaerae bacterium RAS2]
MSKNKQQDQEYRHPIPRKQVLLLSCMDLRLLDDTVEFMNRLNLTNRYDQIVFAGAALGVLRLHSPPANAKVASSSSKWSDVFFHHLQVAIDVLGRKIKDIFILEHRDCGAYQHFHPTHNKPYEEGEEALEEKHHREQAFLLAEAIRDYCRDQQERARKSLRKAKAEGNSADQIKAENQLDAWADIKVRCFLMELDGEVKHLRKSKKKHNKSKSRTKRKK